MRRHLMHIILGVVFCHLTIASAMAAGAGERNVAGDSLQGFTGATHYIWTNKLVYVPGEDNSVDLYWTADPHEDPYPYTIFFYMENVDTGARQYVANGALTDEVRDVYGNAEGAFLRAPIPVKTKMHVGSFALPSTGYYHFVAEIRDVNAGQVIKKAYAKFNVVDNVVTLGGDATDTEISQDTTWNRHTLYRIRYQVFVNNGATLTVEPGTVVLAQGQNAVIVVEQGGKMISDGLREQPIVYSCDAPVGERFSGCWAGIIVLGRAPVNWPGNTGLAEGVVPASRPVYGGNDPHDNSGIYRYSRVEFAGVDFTDEIQPNAWGFHGVGDGTIVSYIQGHEGEDDDVEYFGGTVNADHVVSSGAKDDLYDQTAGWTGKTQFLLLMSNYTTGDRGIELDGLENQRDNLPRTRPFYYNVTIIGSDISNRCMLTREGGAVEMHNFIFMNCGDDGWEENHPETAAARLAGLTHIDHGTFWNNAGGAVGPAQIDAGVRDWLVQQPDVFFDNPHLRNPRYEGNPDPRPMEGSIALTVGNTVAPPSTLTRPSNGPLPERSEEGFYDTSASCMGAFCNGDLWISEWTWFGEENLYAVQ